MVKSKRRQIKLHRAQHIVPIPRSERAQVRLSKVHRIFPKPSGEWVIKRDGATKATKVFSTRAAALKYAHELSHRQGTEIVIHGYDGKIMSTYSYGEVTQSGTRPESGFGCARGLIIIPPNFDEPLEEFGEHI